MHACQQHMAGALADAAFIQCRTVELLPRLFFAYKNILHRTNYYHSIHSPPDILHERRPSNHVRRLLLHPHPPLHPMRHQYVPHLHHDIIFKTSS